MISEMFFTPAKLEKMADLFLDLAKGLILTALIAPAFSGLVELINSTRMLATGVLFAFLAMRFVEMEEVG